MSDTATPHDAPRLSILIPFLNEEGNVLELTREIVAAMQAGPSYELIYVDDGSTDATGAEIDEALALAPAPGRRLRHAEPAGKSAALRSAMRVARGEWLQMIDGDGQQDPADILRVWELLIAPGAPDDLGLVSGARIGRHDSKWKWFSARIANGVRRALLGDGCKDTGCGFKLMRAAVAPDLPYFSTMHRFLPALTRRAGWDVVETPVTDRPRREGVSKYGTWDRLVRSVFDLVGMVWLIQRKRAGRVVEDSAK